MNPRHNSDRRRLLTALRGLGLLALGGWTGVMRAASPVPLLTFKPVTLEAALREAGVDAVQPSEQLRLNAPDVAEDGSAVQISVSTSLPARRLLVLVEKNRIPLVASFEFPPGTRPFLATRIKMAGDSRVLAVVEADGRWFSAAREVRVTVGGCGG